MLHLHLEWMQRPCPSTVEVCGCWTWGWGACRWLGEICFYPLFKVVRRSLVRCDTRYKLLGKRVEGRYGKVVGAKGGGDVWQVEGEGRRAGSVCVPVAGDICIAMVTR